MVTYGSLRVLCKARSISEAVVLNGKVPEQLRTAEQFVEGQPAICYQGYKKNLEVSITAHQAPFTFYLKLPVLMSYPTSPKKPPKNPTKIPLLNFHFHQCRLQ